MHQFHPKEQLSIHFQAWVGPMVGKDAILGMDFMVPAGIQLDLMDGTICLPNEAWI